MKKFMKTIVPVVLCLALLVCSVPVTFAASSTTPKAPIALKYVSDYATNEHCVSFTPTSKADGYQIQIIHNNGTVGLNWYSRTANETRAFYKDGGRYYLTKLSFNDKSGEFYKIRVRAFNNPSGKYESPVTGFEKPNSSAKYSSWSTATYGADATKSVKATRVNNKQDVKISWDKFKGADKYELTVIFLDNKYVNVKSTLTSTSKTFTKISGKSLKNVKKLTVQVVPIKVVGKTTYRGAENKQCTVTIK